MAKADKGGAVVLLDTELYIKLKREMFDDNKTYTKLGTDPTKSIVTKRRIVLDEGRSLGVINQKLYEHVLNNQSFLFFVHSHSYTNINSLRP